MKPNRALLSSLGCSLALLTVHCGHDTDEETTTSPPHTPSSSQSGQSDLTNKSNDDKTDTATTEDTDKAVENKTIPKEFLANAGDGWQTLVIGSWEIPPNKEIYHCVRMTLPKDISIGAVRALSPRGTHHTLLTIADDTSMADGESPCDAGTNGTQEIAGSGVGTNDFSLPDGVAITLKAGQQLLLNLHLFNTTDEPIRGTSGTLIKLLAADEVQHHAEGVLAGTVTLDLPPGAKTTQRGTCTVQDDVTLVAAAPHMHQLGTYQKAVAHSSVQGDVVLRDGPYSFDEQLIYALPELIEMKTGDKIDVECTYENTTDQAVKFGNGSLAEMCFTGLYWYPAMGRQFVCVK